ncbi:MAG: dynamin family protein [Egibacteraceae bacterium]
MTGTSPSLTGAVRAVLRHAVEAYQDTSEAVTLRELADRLDSPLRVAIAGKVKSGKSTLLNALVGEEIAPTDAGECTQVVTWYRNGHSPRVTLHPHRGAPRRLVVRRAESGALALDLGGVPAAEVERLVVDWPSRRLRAMTLIDTPGIGSLSRDASARTQALLAPDDAPAAADAVLYLMRHLHAGDVRFLESFRDGGGARATPVNAIAVLSRADEIGAGRIDAMLSAKRIAKRYRADPHVRRLCQTVMPVAGLLAQAGTTLRETECAALATLAAAERADVEALLLSADRFVRAEAPLSSEERAALLERLGLFGIRLCITMIRQGVQGCAALAAELVRRSGLDELRQALSTQFAQRRDLLKARSALLALDQLLRTRPLAGTQPIVARVERILAGAHEFAEFHLLGSLRTGALGLRADEITEAERLLGGGGASPAARLALDPDASDAQQRAAALDALGRWQRRAGSPLTARPLADACRVIVRSCEGILAILSTGEVG